jgi:glycosyltransferase involved in cell wall biosynthesis
MTGGPKFSVVIPAYNSSGLIGGAIRSVLQQTIDDFELIVVDDGSTDNTPQVVEAVTDPRLRLVRQDNTGTAGARNRGVRESNGEYISFLDNDDLWMPTYLEVMGAALDANTQAGFAYTDGWALDDEAHQIRRRPTMSRANPPVPPPSDPEAFLAELMSRNFILSSVTVRRSAIDRVDGFRDGLGGCDDYDLWIRIVGARYGGVRAPGLLVIQRDRHDSQSKDSLRMLRGIERVVSSALAEQPLSDRARYAGAEQLAGIRREISALSGEISPAAVVYRSRSVLSRLRDRLLRRRLNYSKPPPEVAAAFPDLEDL